MCMLKHAIFIAYLPNKNLKLLARLDLIPAGDGLAVMTIRVCKPGTPTHSPFLHQWSGAEKISWQFENANLALLLSK